VCLEWYSNFLSFVVKLICHEVFVKLIEEFLKKGFFSVVGEQAFINLYGPFFLFQVKQSLFRCFAKISHLKADFR